MVETMRQRGERRNLGWLLGLAAWALGGAIFWCLATAAPVRALSVSFHNLVFSHYILPQENLAPPESELQTRWLDPYNWSDQDLLDLLMDRAIRDENWSEWQAYHADTEARIPLAASRQIVRSMNRLNPVEKRLVVRMARAPQVREAMVSSQKEDELIERVFGLLTAQQKQIGPISEAPPEREAAHFIALDFLFTEDGVFSGRAWDWDNFLPRILTLGGLVIGFLLLVELLRMIVQVGVRTLSMRTRGK